MSVTQPLDKLIKEIKLFIHYAVPENEVGIACALVERYRNHRRILNLLRAYYVALPDAKEEAVVRVSELVQRQGAFLFVLTTTTTAHLYAVSMDEVVWLGEYAGELSLELLEFWGLSDQVDLSNICVPVSALEDYSGGGKSKRGECPACGVEEGEYHLLGCLVEICPWCEGQLSKCNCRFEQLEVDTIANEEQLQHFLELLTAKGRIPFQQNQAPFYPGTSDGLDQNEPGS